MVYKKLPEAYKGKQISRIELERSKILSRLIKTIQAILAVLLLAAGCLFMPPAELTNMPDPFEHLVALMLGMLSVSVVHELGRGLLMRLFSGVKPTLRFAGAYLHAGCDAYFPRKITDSPADSHSDHSAAFRAGFILAVDGLDCDDCQPVLRRREHLCKRPFHPDACRHTGAKRGAHLSGVFSCSGRINPTDKEGYRQ